MLCSIKIEGWPGGSVVATRRFSHEKMGMYSSLMVWL